MILLSALAHAGATLAMKAAAHAAGTPITVLLVACLRAAVPGVAWFPGDEMTARQMMGGSAVLAGTLLLAT